MRCYCGATENLIRNGSKNGKRQWMCQLCRRRKHFKLAYGITLEEFEVQLERQNGCCAICDREVLADAEYRNDRAAVVDHCHDTGKVRGILCQGCNKVLGVLGDDLTERVREFSTNAIAYLTFNPWSENEG